MSQGFKGCREQLDAGGGHIEKLAARVFEVVHGCGVAEGLVVEASVEVAIASDPNIYTKQRLRDRSFARLVPTTSATPLHVPSIPSIYARAKAELSLTLPFL